MHQDNLRKRSYIPYKYITALLGTKIGSTCDFTKCFKGYITNYVIVSLLVNHRCNMKNIQLGPM